jgi:hypothetical protein
VEARAALGCKYDNYSLKGKRRRSENKTREDSPQSKFQNLFSTTTLLLDKTYGSSEGTGRGSDGGEGKEAELHGIFVK